MALTSWIRIFLILIPLVVVGFSVYWIILVTEPVFIAACGSGKLILGILIACTALCSCVFAYFGLKSPLNYSLWQFNVFLTTTIVGIFLVIIAMVSTSTESQSICAMQIKTYCATHSDGRVTGYLNKYGSEYKQLLYQYAFGQTAYEGYLILGCSWIAAFIGFFAMKELDLK